jgi:hypothetical protein
LLECWHLITPLKVLSWPLMVGALFKYLINITFIIMLTVGGDAPQDLGARTTTYISEERKQRLKVCAMYNRRSAQETLDDLIGDAIGARGRRTMMAMSEDDAGTVAWIAQEMDVSDEEALSFMIDTVRVLFDPGTSFADLLTSPLSDLIDRARASHDE